MCQEGTTAAQSMKAAAGARRLSSRNQCTQNSFKPGLVFMKWLIKLEMYFHIEWKIWVEFITKSRLRSGGKQNSKPITSEKYKRK